MKKYFLYELIFMIIFLINFQVLLNSQTNTFQAVIGGDHNYSYPRVIDAGNNESMVLYRSESYASDYDVMLSKLDSIGKTIWTKKFSDYQRNLSKEIFKTNYGFLLLLWRAHESKIDDWHLIKIDNEGNVLAEKFIGSSMDEELQYVVPLDNNKYAVASNIRMNSTNASFSIMESDLTVTNTKTFVIDNADQGLRSAVLTENENIIICGWHSPFGSEHKPLLIETDLSGNLIFMYSIAMDGTSELTNLISSAKNEVLVVGFTNGLNNGDYDILVLKIKEDGTIVWAKTYGGFGDDKGFDIHEKDDGTFLITGETASEGNDSDLFLINIDEEGNLLWGEVYGGSGDEFFGYADITENKQVLIAGHSESFNKNSTEIFIVKADENGKSCCGKEIQSFITKKIHPQIEALYPIIIDDYLPEASFTISKQTITPNNYLVCYDPLKIVGKKSVCSQSKSVRYTTDPLLNFNFYDWFVSPNITIAEEQDTDLIVDFAQTSGNIYLKSSICEDTYFDSLFVIVENVNPFLGNDTSICSNSSIKLKPDKKYLEYLWQDGSTKSFFTTTGEGLYWLEVENENGCHGSDTISISTIYIPPLDLGPETALIEGDFYLLDAGPGYDSYIWSDLSTQQIKEAYMGGQYWVKASLDKCSESDTIWLFRNPCKINIANTFTPNGDGINDAFFAEPEEEIGAYEMTIFNRWGRVVAQSSDIYYKWDGTHNGQPQPEGTYFVVIEYTCLGSIKSIILKGSITLVR